MPKATRLSSPSIVVVFLVACCLLPATAVLVSCGGGGTAAITVAAAITVSVRPATWTVPPSGTCTFTTEVTGTTNTAVAWTVTEPAAGSVVNGTYTAPATEGAFHVVATSVADPAASDSAEVTVHTGAAGLTDLFFLHHSVGNGLVVGGDMRGAIVTYNTNHGTSFEFWDHGYNSPGLRNPAGDLTGTNYNVPDDNTDPAGLYLLWTSSEQGYVDCRNLILNHQVIAFKSCFPNSAITDADMLNQYKSWYLSMWDFFDTRPDRLFVVMSTPPLHRLATNQTEAANARAFANWLGSSTYLSGHANVRCFDLFDYLARPDDGTATANMLRYDFEDNHSNDDSHPNTLANETVGPILADFLCNAAAGY